MKLHEKNKNKQREMSTTKTKKKTTGIDSKTKAALQKIPLLSLKAGQYYYYYSTLLSFNEHARRQVRDRPIGRNV